MDEDYAADDLVERPKIDLSPDEIADAVLRGERGPLNLITLCGFVGRSDVPGHIRLFTDAALRCWVDIAGKDIRHRRRLPAEEGFGARSMVWVKAGALLVRGELTVASAESDFLGGCPPCDEPDDDLDCVTEGPVQVSYMASPKATPAGYACCH